MSKDDKRKCLLQFYRRCLEKEGAFEKVLQRSSSKNEYVFYPLDEEILISGIADEGLSVTQDIKQVAETAVNKSHSLFYGWPTALFYELHETSSGKTHRRRKLIPLLLLEFVLPEKGQPIPSTLGVSAEVPEIHPEVLSRMGYKGELSTFLNEFPIEPHLGSHSAISSYVQTVADEIGLQVQEKLEASNLSLPPEGEIDGQGLHNVATIYRAPRKSFNKHLLRELEELEDKSIENTALKSLFESSIESTERDKEPTITTPLSLNESQEEVLQRAFSSPITVVTGPPGTGKSQVVASSVSSHWAINESVLVASTNNQAVDVVSDKMHDIVPGVLIRTGNKQNREEAMELLTDLLSGNQSVVDEDVSRTSVKRTRQEISRIRDEIQKRTEIEMRLSNLARTRSELIESFWNESHLEQFLDDKSKDELEQIKSKIVNAKKCRQKRAQVMDELDDFNRKQKQLIKKMHTDEDELFSCLSRDQIEPISKKVRHLEQVWLFKKIRWFIFCWMNDVWIENRDITRARALFKFELQSREHEKELDELPDEHALRRAVAKTVGFKRLPEKWGADKLIDSLDKLLEKEIEWRRLKTALDDIHDVQALKRNLLETEDKHKEASKKLLQTLVDQSVRSGQEAIKKYKSAKYDRRTNTGRERHFPEVLKYLKGWASTSLSTAPNFPLKKGLFDLVIIDEASQCSIPSALPLLFRAKRALIIGDPKQLSHIPNVQKEQEQEAANEAGLSLDVLQEENLSYRDHSLYDCFENKISNSEVLFLDEHYRSHPQIIQLSNQLFYEDSLTVLTEPKKLIDFGEHAVSWKQVEGKTVRPSSGSAFNKLEAEEVTRTFCNLISKLPQDRTVGIVTPFSRQSSLIDQKISEEVDEETRVKHSLSIGTAHRFQGDEKDVVIFSPVASKGIPQSSASWLVGTKNLFNVAVTRARSYLMVVGDKSKSKEIGGLLGELAHFIEKTRQKEERKEAVQEGDIHSRAERYLFESLQDLGVEVTSKERVSHYECDFVIRTGNVVLNIECDGRQHLNSAGRQRRQDLARDRLIEEHGWNVFRVPAWKCLTKPKEVSKQIAARIKDIG